MFSAEEKVRGGFKTSRLRMFKDRKSQEFSFHTQLISEIERILLFH